MAILKYLIASRPCNMRALEVVGWRQGLTMVLMLMIAIRVVEGLTPTPPILPKRYQGNGNTLQLLLNESWPLAQGPASTFTFFAPENSAIKVLFVEHSRSFQNHQWNASFLNKPALGVVDVQPTRVYNDLFVSFFFQRFCYIFSCTKNKKIKKIAWTLFRCSPKHVDRKFSFLRKQTLVCLLHPCKLR